LIFAGAGLAQNLTTDDIHRVGFVNGRAWLTRELNGKANYLAGFRDAMIVQASADDKSPLLLGTGYKIGVTSG
jgi:hypothetical protein